MPVDNRFTCDSGAFSLVELLVVVAIVGLLSTFAITAFNQSLRGTKITSTGQAISDAMNLARSLALSKNVPVQIRFYKMPNPNGGGTVVRALQIFACESRSTNAATKPFIFPDQIVASSDSKKSSFVNATNVSASASDPKVSGTNYDYVPVTFGASGIIQPVGTLNSTNEWYITVQALKDMANDASWPANYATVSINPVIGDARVFQPH